jgi:hypothetical protein
MMSDCSSVSDYQEFISVFKAEAGKHGANGVVILKSPGTNTTGLSQGLCVDAQAIIMKPQTERTFKTDESSCIEYLKQIIALQKIIDSLKEIIAKK